MIERRALAAMVFGLAALAAAMMMAASAAQAHDETKYPDFGGQWSRSTGSAAWDQSKPGGLRQQPPLTPEYQAIFEANLASLAAGGEVYNQQATCLPSGMPRMMIAYEPIELIITARTTYVRVDHLSEFRRIYTDGRGWPVEIEPTFTGYSIGRWIDEDGDGRYDVLEVETRGLKGPHAYDATGIPFHSDYLAVIKERLYLDKANADLLRNEVTAIDHALTRPWTVTRSYHRDRNAAWYEHVCVEENHHVVIGKESYFLSADGKLMPTRKGQPPPDLKYFNQAKK
jgi:hypothetical protein